MRGANLAIIARRHRHGDRSWVPRQWVIWTAPRRVAVFVLIVEMAAVGLTITRASPEMGKETLLRFAAILGLGLGMGEMSRHVERVRRRFTDTPHVNLTSVWTFPAALLLPPLLTAGVVTTLYLHLFWRSWYRVRGVHAYRLVYTASTVVLAAYTAGAVCRGFGFIPTDLVQWGHPASVGIVAVAIVAYSMVNSGLVAAAITLYERRLDIRRALGTGPDSALEYGTLGIGAATTALISLHPAWALVIVPALLVLHRSALVRQLEESASTDPKTGLTNATAWSSLAAAELGRAKQDKTSVGVLMIDLDRFATVNGRFGHPAGDRVLRVLADMLRSAVRRDDEVGQWSGEEFVVLCPQVTVEELRLVGERICEHVRQLEIPLADSDSGAVVTGLTVSIGAATYPEFGPDLQDLLLAADNALFVAKDSGRDQVQSIVAAIEGISQDRAAT